MQPLHASRCSLLCSIICSLRLSRSCWRMNASSNLVKRNPTQPPVAYSNCLDVAENASQAKTHRVWRKLHCAPCLLDSETRAAAMRSRRCGFSQRPWFLSAGVTNGHALYSPPAKVIRSVRNVHATGKVSQLTRTAMPGVLHSAFLYDRGGTLSRFVSWLLYYSFAPLSR